MSGRQFQMNPEGDDIPSLLLGFMGPPGGGKTKSALRVGTGMSRIIGGKPAVIDTEAGRSLKHRKSSRNPNGHEFDYIPFAPPFVPEHFLDAIRFALSFKPSCVIVDSMSDEHEGEGGYLEWHDREVPESGGNKWAAWAKPSASRRKLIAGIQHIKTPIIFTFRAREKTKQVGKKIVPVGFTPIAPSEIVHTLDLACLLPPRADGVALWESPMENETMALKTQDFLAEAIRRGATLDEEFGERLARWQRGESMQAGASGGGSRTRTVEEMTDGYIASINDVQKVSTLKELEAFQQAQGTAKFISTMKETRKDLFDRIVAANVSRAAALAPRDPEPEPEPDAIEDDDVLFPDDPREDE